MRGHIRRRGKTSWELKFDIGIDPLTRKRVTKYQSFKGTKREAQSELVQLLDPHAAGITSTLRKRRWASSSIVGKGIGRRRMSAQRPSNATKSF